ncbi:MAG: GH92 family glycosyl hydrolase [Bacteroidota bacterium]
MNRLAVICLCALWVNCSEQSAVNHSSYPAKLVYPLLDAANSRWFYFSSATRPFGMVNLSPDMGVGGAWSSGYRYNEDTIRFFSHIHAWQLSGVPVLPTSGEFNGYLGSDVYGSKYSHASERVEAGYHSVFLDDYGIQVELTASTRVGFHRYSFPSDKKKHVLLDLGTHLGPSPTKMGMAQKISENEIAGYALMQVTRRRPKDTYVYFVIRLDQPFDRMSSWQDKRPLGPTERFEGENGGVYLTFNQEAPDEIQMKVAISYVSIDQARLNLDNEIDHWDFDQVRKEAFDEWNRWLSRIKVEGGTQKQQARFYTDLWHALQGRRIVSDYNGKYCDMTGDAPRIGQIPLDNEGRPRFNHFNSDAFWGAQWTLNTLWHLVYPEISEQFINSMLLMYEDGGLIPRGPSGGNYTYVMTGASSTPFIVSAYMKGIRGFDVDKAYEGLVKNAMPGGLMSKAGYEHETTLGGGLKHYIENGYVPFPNPDKNNGYHNEGAGQTLEYAYQDWTLSQLAGVLEKEDDAKYFQHRAGNYKNVWDTSYRWMRPKAINGVFEKPFNPLLSHHGFVESTAAQMTWFVPHDMQGLFNLMGGREAAAKKLNQQFLISDNHDFISKPYKKDKFVQQERRNTYLNYGNQPSMQVGFVFNYTGKPWLTQYWTREIVERIYSDLDPFNGYNGDEDQGLMGALAVLLKMGLFQMRGGAAIEPIYEIGSPLFDKITIQLNPEYYPGGEFVVELKNNSSLNKYVQNAFLDGEKLNQAWFYHRDLVNGGKLVLEMGEKPNTLWGSSPSSLPPSMSTEK